MSLTIDSLNNSREFSHHVCSEVNFEAIRASLTLQSACELLQNTLFQHLLLGKRLTTQWTSNTNRGSFGQLLSIGISIKMTQDKQCSHCEKKIFNLAR